jgi:phosphatidylinositol glycan class B
LHSQLFLSLTNLFHAHALARPLTTSAETCLTIVALYYWPFRSPVEGIAGNTSHSRRIDFGRLALSLTLSATAFILRPTNLTFWAVLGTDLLVRIGRRDLFAGFKVIALAVFIG